MADVLYEYPGVNFAAEQYARTLTSMPGATCVYSTADVIKKVIPSSLVEGQPTGRYRITTQPNGGMDLYIEVKGTLRNRWVHEDRLTIGEARTSHVMRCCK